LDSDPRPPRRRRWPWVLLGLALAGAAGARALLPLAIERGLEAALPRQVGIPLEIAGVDLRLLRGELALEGVAVGRPHAASGPGPMDPERAPLRLGRIFARLDWWALFERRLRLRELVVEAPVVRLGLLPDGTLASPLPPGSRGAEEAAPAQEPAAAPPPWAFQVDRLELSGASLRILDPAREEAALDLSLEEIALGPLALEGEELSLGAIGIRGPVLRVQKSLVLGEAEPTPEPAEPAAAPAGYRIESLAIEGAVLALLGGAEPLEVELALEASDIRAPLREPFPIELALQFGGGELELAGELGLLPVAFEGSLRWHDLPLPPLASAARPELAAWIRSCRSEGDLAVSLHLAGDPGPKAGGAEAGEGSGLRVAGRLAVRELSLADPEEQEVALSWESLEIALREATLPLGPPSPPPAAPARVSIEGIDLVGPALLYARPAPALEALLGPPEAGAAEPPAGPAGEPEGDSSPPPLELSVDAARVSAGSLRVADRSTAPPFASEVHDVAVEVRELRWPELRAAELRASGVAPQQAAFAVEGKLEPGAGELSLRVDRLALLPLEPFAGPAGYRIGAGQASLRSQLRRRGQRYEAENDLVLHRLALSSTRPGAFEKAFGLPLDVALALLRDTAGDIRLPLRIAVEGSGVGTDLRATVLAALRQALRGVIASPLKLVGAVFGAGGEAGEISLEPLPALAGSAGLLPGAAERLPPLGALLASRPMLGLVLRGRAGPADRPALARQILAEQGLAPEDEELLARAVEAVAVPAGREALLARRRAERVRERLLEGSGVDAARVSIGEPESDGEPGVSIGFTARPG